MKRTLFITIAAIYTFGVSAQALFKDNKYHAPIKVE